MLVITARALNSVSVINAAQVRWWRMSVDLILAACHHSGRSVCYVSNRISNDVSVINTGTNNGGGHVLELVSLPRVLPLSHDTDARGGIPRPLGLSRHIYT